MGEYASWLDWYLQSNGRSEGVAHVEFGFAFWGKIGASLFGLPEAAGPQLGEYMNQVTSLFAKDAATQECSRRQGWHVWLSLDILRRYLARIRLRCGVAQAMYIFLVAADIAWAWVDDAALSPRTMCAQFGVNRQCLMHNKLAILDTIDWTVAPVFGAGGPEPAAVCRRRAPPAQRGSAEKRPRGAPP